MSFKREGDDGSQLNVLKKRRVADLLASFIPEDEAILMKNGRYACSVCFQRPVFDTLDMLTVHRRGKKHIASLQRHYGKKREFENQLLKRQHQEYVVAEETGQQALPLPGPAPLLTQTRKITHHALLKAAPYNSCSVRNRPENSSRDVAVPASCEPYIAKRCKNIETDLAAGATEANPTSTAAAEHVDLETSTRSLPQFIAGSPGAQKRKQPMKTKKHLKNPTPAADTERLRSMEHYLRLRSSGWIPDGTGKWVKDEGVEFDSDEEEPPPLEGS